MFWREWCAPDEISNNWSSTSGPATMIKILIDISSSIWLLISFLDRSNVSSYSYFGRGDHAGRKRFSAILTSKEDQAVRCCAFEMLTSNSPCFFFKVFETDINDGFIFFTNLSNKSLLTNGVEQAICQTLLWGLGRKAINIASLQKFFLSFSVCVEKKITFSCPGSSVREWY